MQKFSRSAKLMGNRFAFTVVAKSSADADIFIDMAIGEIQRIENLLTTFSETSQTHKINAAAGLYPVAVDEEVFRLIERSQTISRITQGAFDLSYGSVDRTLWNFDQTMVKLPDPQTAKKMVHLIDYRNIILDKASSTVFLAKKGMRIGFGGIGKGYAADRARILLQQHGVTAGIVNASGDLATWGAQPDGSPWTVAISNPDMPQVPFSQVDISNKAVATSGNYEKFVIIDGKKYSHTIDPATGLPISGIKSVTIISESAELSDALATPVSVMGIEAGLGMINQLPGISALIIDDQNQLFTSKNINLL